MTVSWTPVVVVDTAGSLLTLAIALLCARKSWHWRRADQKDIFRDYIFLLTLAVVFFAVSRSFGHLVKQILLYHNLHRLWATISPYSGAVNSAAFIIIFAFSISFQRFQKIHEELEQLVQRRTSELARTNTKLMEENEQRRRAEEQLRQTSATLVNIFNSTAPICITAMDYQLLETNEAYRKIWPASRHETDTPLKCYESRPGQLCHTDRCPLERILGGEKQNTGEVLKTFPDGSKKYFLQTTRPFRDADGKLIGAVTSFQEITERKKALHELAAEQKRLAVTLRSIGDGVITTDTDGRVRMLNREAEKLCGWQQEEAMGRPLEEVFRITAEGRNEEVFNPVERILAADTIMPLSHQTILTARDGTRRIIADSGAPIRVANDKVIGVVLVFRDVTERVRMEEELQKTRKLEAVGILAGGIAHDFNNILAAILGNINMARVRLDDREGKVTPLLVDAEKASLRAKELTRQLLTFARGGSPIRQTVSLGGIIRDSALFNLRGSTVRCKMDLPDDLWLADVDPGQMSQVIQNIVINAREAMTGGGTLTISGRNREGRLPETNLPHVRWVEIRLKDEGPGMGPEILKNLFDPYFTTKKRGSGLGLAICHSIITRHQGIIRATSTPGKGTEFSLLLPASSKKTARTKPEPAGRIDPPFRKKRILIMDDEEMVCEVAEKMLHHMGHTTLAVHDGRQAVDCYREAMDQGERFDLVIMDLTIPGGMGGKDAITEILKLDPAARVVVTSGYSNEPVMAEFAKYGFRAAITKPFRLHDLTETVQAALLSS